VDIYFLYASLTPNLWTPFPPLKTLVICSLWLFLKKAVGVFREIVFASCLVAFLVSCFPSLREVCVLGTRILFLYISVCVCASKNLRVLYNNSYCNNVVFD